MSSAPSPTLRLLVAALALPACTQTLDFDGVSTKQASVEEGDSSSPEAFSCAMQSKAPTFCDDFDDRAPSKVWSRVLLSPSDGDGSIRANDDEALSEPNSLLATVQGSFDDDVHYAASALQRTFTAFEGQPIRVRVEFDLRVESFDPFTNAHVIAFQFLFGDPEGDYNALVLNLESRKTRIAAQFTETVGPKFDQRAGDYENTPDVDDWVHVEFELDAQNPEGRDNGGKNHVTMHVDDVKLFDNDLSFDLRGGPPRMELGIPWVDYNIATRPWRIRYDNVLVYVEPK